MMLLRIFLLALQATAVWAQACADDATYSGPYGYTCSDWFVNGQSECSTTAFTAVAQCGLNPQSATGLIIPYTDSCGVACQVAGIYAGCYWTAAETAAIRAACPVTCNTCPTPTPTAATPTPTAATARRDPHLTLAHGGRADFRGTDGDVYNLLSAKNVSLNVQTKFADFHMKRTLLHGSHMSQVYVTMRTGQTGRILKIAFNATDAPAKVVAHVEEAGRFLTLSTGAITTEDTNVRVEDDKMLVVETPKWILKAQVSAFPYGKRNAQKRLIDVAILPQQGYKPDVDQVAPHGIVGQSFDGDAIAISGAMDEHIDGLEATEKTTKAQAEGAIEGVIADYKMPSAFATNFKYSRFDAVQATVRNISALTGIRTARTARAAAGVLAFKTEVVEQTVA